ncbi:PTS sugar transporter subunit IIB [Clostridium guangxiense]|uniref:PTS sugar transporter subunit IIB n=1 Tax=Clostridium guangxiense TaxID=1662055 RepID=UPI001E3CC19F|nr:PTS sugar transporter subunit IIB [Clostridium guangxiense]MCD2346909.1 PTS sugar transporter subunit IIB [Clostridium guangxiense]
MLKRKVILVACGAGIATSTIVCERIEELIKKNKLNARVLQCKISEVYSLEKEADLLLSTTLLPTNYSIPAIRAMAYISGEGMEELDEKIIKVINEK